MAAPTSQGEQALACFGRGVQHDSATGGYERLYDRGDPGGCPDQNTSQAIGSCRRYSTLMGSGRALASVEGRAGRVSPVSCSIVSGSKASRA